MSNLRNIGGDSGDKFFRYKMPDIVSKVEKPGTNGQQTVILNIFEIGRAIKIDPEYPTRFFAYELGAQGTYMATSDRTCAILKGLHRTDELRKLLEKFIAMFILCPTCKLPETTLSTTKRDVRASCASCGFAGALNTGHRLEKFIINHPPAGQAKSGKKKKKRAGKKDKRRDEEPAEVAAPKPSGHIVPEIKASEAAPKTLAELKPASNGKTQWTADVSAEAQERRMQALMSAETADSKRSRLVGKVDNSKPEQVLRAFTIEADREVHEIVSELQRLRLSHDLSTQEKFRVLLEGLIDIHKPKKLAKQFKKQIKVLRAVTKSDAMRNMLITSIVRFLQDGNMNRLPIVLQCLHDKDVLDDDSVIAWFNSPPESDAAAVGKQTAIEARKEAQVFVEWLQQESGDEGSDSD